MLSQSQARLLTYDLYILSHAKFLAHTFMVKLPLRNAVLSGQVLCQVKVQWETEILARHDDEEKSSCAAPATVPLRRLL